jgi:hypothetical protein
MMCILVLVSHHPSRVVRNIVTKLTFSSDCSLGCGFFVLLYYLPIYFQPVQDVTASQSGIHNLPTILAMSKSTSFHGIIFKQS